MRFPFGIEPGLRTVLDRPPRIRVRDAERDGVQCFGVRRGAFRHPLTRSAVRGDLVRTRAGAARHCVATPDDRAIDYTRTLDLDRFDTWCLQCSTRVRVELSQRTG